MDHKFSQSMAAENAFIEKAFFPDEVVSRVAVFNKANGAFLNLMDDLPIDSLGGSEFFIYERVRINPRRELIVGDYETYKIELIQDQLPQKFESDLDKTCQDRVDKQYPLSKRLRIIEKSLARLVSILEAVPAAKEALESEDVQDLLEMADKIEEINRSNEVRKASYKGNPKFEYISVEDERKALERRLEGGQHEILYGARKAGVSNGLSKH